MTTETRVLDASRAMPRPLDEARHVRAFVGASVVVWALLSGLSLVRAHTFHASLYDLGILHQVLWNTAHGRPFASSVSHMSYLGDHFSPTFALLAPLEWLPRSLDLLLIAQAGAVPLVAWNVYRLARRHVSPRAAWLIGMGTLLSPQLYCPTLADLHPEPFMAVALSYALLALDAGRELRAALWLLLVLGGKEDAALLLSAFGVLLAFEPRTRRFGALLAVGIRGLRGRRRRRRDAVVPAARPARCPLAVPGTLRASRRVSEGDRPQRAPAPASRARRLHDGRAARHARDPARPLCLRPAPLPAHAGDPPVRGRALPERAQRRVLLPLSLPRPRDAAPRVGRDRRRVLDHREAPSPDRGLRPLGGGALHRVALRPGAADAPAEPGRARRRDRSGPRGGAGVRRELVRRRARGARAGRLLHDVGVGA